MPPQTPPVPPSSNQVPSPTSKKVKNAGQSVLVMGCFMTFIMLVALLGVKSLPEGDRAIAYGYLVFVLLANVFLIFQGVKIKQNKDNLPAASSAIQLSLIIAFAVFVVDFIGFLLKPGGGGLAGLFALILGVYLLVVQTDIKKLHP